jgi:hypothetical protein
MPSGRDSFRRNRVAPFVLFYFTMLMVDGALAGRSVCFVNPEATIPSRDRSFYAV